MLLLNDGTAIVGHDLHEKYYGFDGSFTKASWNEVKNLRYLGRKGRLNLTHTIMGMKELADLLAAYPDAYLVTDTKYLRSEKDHIQILKQLASVAAPSVLDRIIPHLRGQKELDAFKAIYPWRDYMLALYRTQWLGQMSNHEVLDFVVKNNIRGVMMWFREADPALSLKDNHKKHQRFSLDFARQLQGVGVGVYVHDMVDKADVARFRDLDVGVYSKQWIGKPYKLTWLIQILIGGIAAGAVFFKLYWHKLKSFFARNRSQSSDNDVKKQPDQ